MALYELSEHTPRQCEDEVGLLLTSAFTSNGLRWRILRTFLHSNRCSESDKDFSETDFIITLNVSSSCSLREIFSPPHHRLIPSSTSLHNYSWRFPARSRFQSKGDQTLPGAAPWALEPLLVAFKCATEIKLTWPNLTWQSLHACSLGRYTVRREFKIISIYMLIWCFFLMAYVVKKKCCTNNNGVESNRIWSTRLEGCYPAVATCVQPCPKAWTHRSFTIGDEIFMLPLGESADYLFPYREQRFRMTDKNTHYTHGVSRWEVPVEWLSGAGEWGCT